MVPPYLSSRKLTLTGNSSSQIRVVTRHGRRTTCKPVFDMGVVSLRYLVRPGNVIGYSYYWKAISIAVALESSAARRERYLSRGLQDSRTILYMGRFGKLDDSSL